MLLESRSDSVKLNASKVTRSEGHVYRCVLKYLQALYLSIQMN